MLLIIPFNTFLVNNLLRWTESSAVAGQSFARKHGRGQSSPRSVPGTWEAPVYSRWLGRLQSCILVNVGMIISYKMIILWSFWCPLTDDQVNKIFSENAFDAVMHFAAVAYVGESTLEPLRCVRLVSYGAKISWMRFIFYFNCLNVCTRFCCCRCCCFNLLGIV